MDLWRGGGSGRFDFLREGLCLKLVCFAGCFAFCFGCLSRLGFDELLVRWMSCCWVHALPCMYIHLWRFVSVMINVYMILV